MQADHYRTLASTAESRLKVERSEFLGLAFPCGSDEEFFAGLQRIEKQYFDATHHCWAFRTFGDSSPRQRSSDAGEPSGSAGKPILSAIESASLFDAAVVVVRWFGGVKLGTGGLSRAYREAATATLRSAQTVERLLYDSYDVVVPFDSVGAIYRLLAPPSSRVCASHSSLTSVPAIRSPVLGRPTSTKATSIMFHPGTTSGKLRTSERK